MVQSTQYELAAFVPADVRSAILSGQPLADQGHGSVLEADLSSFSPLTEALALKHGPRRGAEEVAALLTRVYGALVAEVDRFCGTVVEFTGDAISCCFHADDDGLRAVHCALAMQAVMPALATPEAHSPGLKVTVALGEFRRFSVGDPRIRLLEVLAGPAVARLVALAPSAGPGEVLADDTIVRRLGARLELAGRRPGAGACAALVEAIRGPPPPPPPTEAWSRIGSREVRPWLLPAVHQRLLDGEAHLLGELRSVVALFACFSGIDYADGDAGPRLDAYARFAQRTLADYGGTLFTIAVDAKGSHLCAGFGAPLAHDDDPLRAAAAALALRHPPASAGGVNPGGIGLTSGQLYAGTYGGRTRQTFGLQGSEMNLAARLMQNAAPGQILVEEPLARRLDGRHALRALPPQQVKGRETPVAARELLGTRRSAAPPVAPDLVDRRGERAALELHLDRLRQHSGGVLVLEGEPGIGKSRLVSHLADRAAAEGFAVHAGAGDPIERGAPYHGWRPVFGDALGLADMPEDGDAGLELVLQRLTLATGAPPADGDADLAALLSAVLPVAVPEGPVSAGLSGEARGEATRDLLAQTLGAVARAAPTLVILEDAHWLDSASLALALRLAVAPGPLLLVLTTRPVAEAARAELERLLATPGCQRMRVGPLGAADAVDLATRALGGGTLPPRLVSLIEAKAGGNPLFTRELAYAARDRGLLEPGGAELPDPTDELAASESPDTIASVIASRLDRLPPAAQTLLKVASVLGLSFAEDALLALAGPRAFEHRARLETLELLAATATDAPGAIAFRHALIRDVVYSQLLYAQRRDLHRQAAEYYERTGAPGSTRAALAHHWEQAEQPARAVAHLVAAGEAALHAGAFRECLVAYQRALALTTGEPDHGRRAEWTWFAAQACYRLGEIERSRDLGAQAIAALDRPVPPGGPAAVGAAAATELVRQVLHRTLPAVLPRPAPPAERHQLRLAVEALAMMAEVYYVAADQARSGYVALRALNLAERLGPSGELAGCYGTMCVIAGLAGAHRQAERYGELSRTTALAVGDPYFIAQSLHQLCHYRSGVGPYGAFSELYATAIDEFRRLGHRPRLRDTVGMGAIADHLFGRPDGAERRMNELLAAVEPHEATLGAAWAHLWLGMVALRRGHPDQTLERLRTADQLRDRQAVDVISVNVHAISALALWRCRRDVEAAVEEDAAWTLVRRLGRRPGAHIVLDGYCALAELALARWDEAASPGERARARRRAGHACRKLRAYARLFPIGAPARWLYAGERARRLGRPDDALAAWRRARAVAAGLDMRHELALAEAALADDLPDAGDRHDHRARATQLLAELGAPSATRAVTPRSPDRAPSPERDAVRPPFRSSPPDAAAVAPGAGAAVGAQAAPPPLGVETVPLALPRPAPEPGSPL